MEGNQNNGQAKELGNLTLKDLFFKYVRFLPVFLVSVALALLGAYLYLRYTTPIYRAQGTITFMMEKASGNNKFDEIFYARNEQDMQTEMEIMKSRALMERVVRAANLQITYYAVGKIKTLNIYKSCPFVLEIFELADSVNAMPFTLNIKFVNDNDFQINNEGPVITFGQLFKNPNGVFRLKKVAYGDVTKGKEFNVTWNPAPTQAAIYASMIRVSPKIAGSNIHNISIDITNPQLGVDIIDTLMAKYQVMSIEEKNRTIDKALEYINLQAKNLQHDLDSIERNILILRKRYNLSDPEMQTSNYFAVMSEAHRMSANEKLKLRILGLVREYLRDENYAFERVPSALEIDDATLNGLIVKYNTLQAERQTLAERGVAARHPRMLEKNELLEQTRTNILENLKNVERSYQTIIDDYYRRANVAEYEVNRMPEKVQQLMEVENEKKIKENLLSFLLEQRETRAMSQASTISNSRIMDQASSSGAPIKPNRRSIQLLSFIIGLGLPAMLIFVQEIINDKISTRYDIEKLTDAAILGEVGHSYSSSSMVVSKTNRSMVAEQFRIIRSNLQYVLNKVDKPVIMVTSSFSGEGKSFVTTNLGGVMALAGKKTVVLEFDIRKPKVFSSLKLKANIGITNFLVGKAKLEDLPVQVPGFENLYAIACGPVPPNPSELLLDSRVKELFDWLKQNFDVVVVDTAPVGMVSDAMTLGEMANTTLYIVRQGHTYKKQISLIDEFYHDNKLPRISIVINDVKLRPGYGYYGYGRYGYGYGYGGGYYEMEKDDKPWFKRILPRKLFKSKK